MRNLAFAAALTLTLAACGGGDQPAPQTTSQPSTPAASAPAAPAAPAELTTPEWYAVDHGARTVTIDLVAGSTPANNAWNFNGLHNGAGEIVVPAGYAVTVNFRNADAMVHSAVVVARAASYPANFTTPGEAFPGAMTSNPTSITDATAPGASESFTFTPTAGDFAIVCEVPPHAVAGMFVNLTVVEGTEAGVRL